MAYAGRLGATRRDAVQISCDCGALFSERLVRAVNAQTDPALVEQLLGGRLDELPCPACARPIHLELPVILHDAAREVFCEIHPISARISELRIHGALMTALAEEPVAVPAYVREGSIVFGRERAAQLYRSGALSGGGRPREGAAAGAHGERERALEERERALDEGETAASARSSEADQREQRLDERQAALDRREDELAQRLRDAEGRVRKTTEREREIDAAAESARRRELDLDSRSVELAKRENELSGEITDAEHRELRFREMNEDIARRERELAALAEQLREREQALDARHGGDDADRATEPAAALLSRLEQLTRRTGRAILPAERGVLLGRTLDRRDIDRAVENAPDLTIQLRIAESYPVVVLAAHLPRPGRARAGDRDLGARRRRSGRQRALRARDPRVHRRGGLLRHRRHRPARFVHVRRPAGRERPLRARPRRGARAARPRPRLELPEGDGGRGGRAARSGRPPDARLHPRLVRRAGVAGAGARRPARGRALVGARELRLPGRGPLLPPRLLPGHRHAGPCARRRVRPRDGRRVHRPRARRRAGGDARGAVRALPSATSPRSA